MRFLFTIAIIFSVLSINPTWANESLGYNKVYGSWSVSCGKQNCAMTQLVAKDPQAKQVMLGVSINYAIASDYGILMVRMPSSANPKAGLGIKVDEQASIQLPMSQCTAAACQAVIKIDKTLLQEFKQGQAVKFAYAIDSNKQVVLPISLDAFSEAYADLAKQQAARGTY